jgi:hypothetical protein
MDLLIQSLFGSLERSLDTFELTRLPNKIVQQIRSLLDGQFLGRTENILAFGNPGTHA